MNQVYLWCVALLTTVIAASTLYRLWTERYRLAKEDLNDEDRAFAWRLVVFVIFPLFVFLDLRATTVTTEFLGGFIKSFTYGFIWYEAIPAGLTSERFVIPSLFAGEIIQCILALLLLPALLFRPHPFLSTVIGYTAAFVLGLNFIAEPILALVGFGGTKWSAAMSMAPIAARMPLVTVHVVLGAIYVWMMRTARVRLWFSELTRPAASDELRRAISTWHASPESARLAFRVGLLYDRAGLRRQAKRLLGRLKSEYRHPLYANFLEGILTYRRREYKKSRQAFLLTSNYPNVDGELKGTLLAAAACAAFADGELVDAINLSERALEFDEQCLVARMVKVDVYLRQGNKEKAGEEILLAMRMGLTLDLENKVPLDTDKAFECLLTAEKETAQERALAGSSRRN